MIQLELTGKPVSWSAPTKGKNGFYDKKSAIKEQARWQIKAQYREKPLEGFVAVDFVFFVPIPKGTSKALKSQMLRRMVLPTSPDSTNLQKLYEDCLEGIVIENDRYVNRVSSVRYFSESPGVLISVRKWDELTGNPNFIQQEQQIAK